MFRPYRIIFLSILAVGLLGAGKTENLVKARVDKVSVSTGEPLRYTLVVEGVFDEPKLKLPEFKGFKIISQAQSENYSHLKSGTRLTLKLEYVLYAGEPGELIIEPATIEDKKSEYKSDPISVRVNGKPLKEKKKILPFLRNSTDL
ncbi:MAG: BatD family protein [Candidatus Omnitrophica bacterium]|nr:BatD family protein [Candidatus Omnitrophota bacterium]MBU2250710.1 BatD family protein [Candidatus Omnitrophota bacterium]MBU2473716.1 BatD family protein [Candidatus Omnitrophota bacterium]